MDSKKKKEKPEIEGKITQKEGEETEAATKSRMSKN